MSVGRSVGARTTHTHARTHMCKQIAKVQRKELSAHQRNLHIVQSSVCGLEYARQASLSLWHSEIETGSAQNFRKKRYFSWPMHARTSPHKRVHNFASTQIGSVSQSCAPSRHHSRQRSHHHQPVAAAVGGSHRPSPNHQKRIVIAYCDGGDGDRQGGEALVCLCVCV